MHTAAIADLLLSVPVVEATINDLDHNELSALGHVCTRSGGRLWKQHVPKVAHVLLKHGANPNAGRFLPLVMAVNSKNWRLTWMLLKAKADPTRPDMHNRTAKPAILKSNWSQTIAFVRANYPP